MVRTEDACEIIKYALQNEIKVYLDGGWGVDALLKRESRIHNDIDLFVELKHYHDSVYIFCSELSAIVIDRAFTDHCTYRSLHFFISHL